MELPEKLKEEAKKALARKDTLLHSRLHDARREIEYLHDVLLRLSALEDKYLPMAFRAFFSEMQKGGRPGEAHPAFRPNEVIALAHDIIRRRNRQNYLDNAK